MVELKGRTALVTGASSGIGAEIAKLLAASGSNLILSARREERLEALANELSSDHGVETSVVAIDLATETGATKLYQACAGKDVSLVINNAGFGDFHRFDEVDLARVQAMVTLNVAAVVELTHRFIADFRRRDDRCYVLNVGSMVAWMPIANFATYCGTKSFIRNFSEALSAELKGSNITVTCLSPGGTRTEFVEVANQKLPKIADKSLMSAERCAKIGVRAMLKGKRNVVPGFSNKFVCFLTRFFPRRAIGGVARSVMGDVQPPSSVDSAVAAE